MTYIQAQSNRRVVGTLSVLNKSSEFGIPNVLQVVTIESSAWEHIALGLHNAIEIAFVFANLDHAMDIRRPLL